MEPQEPEPLPRLVVKLYLDEEYGGYVAEVPELPGCMSQGKTVEEVLKNVGEAIALYLETQRPGS